MYRRCTHYDRQDISNLNLNKIGQIAVSVSDIDRATAFYRDKLGMRFLFSAPPSMSFFDCDGVRLMLTVPERGDDEPKGSAVVHFPVAEVHPADVHPRRIAHGNALYFTVPDVRQATETLKAREASASSASRTSSTAPTPTTSGCHSSPTPTTTCWPSWLRFPA